MQHDSATGKGWLSFLPYAGMIVLLGAANVWLFFLPMAMRM
jgi:hypothetical protein